LKRLAHKSIEGPRVSQTGIRPPNFRHDKVIRIGMGFVAKERSHVVVDIVDAGSAPRQVGFAYVCVDFSLQEPDDKEQCHASRSSLPGRTPLRLRSTL